MPNRFPPIAPPDPPARSRLLNAPLLPWGELCLAGILALILLAL